MKYRGKLAHTQWKFKYIHRQIGLHLLSPNGMQLSWVSSILVYINDKMVNSLTMGSINPWLWRFAELVITRVNFLKLWPNRALRLVTSSGPRGSHSRLTRRPASRIIGALCIDLDSGTTWVTGTLRASGLRSSDSETKDNCMGRCNSRRIYKMCKIWDKY